MTPEEKKHLEERVIDMLKSVYDPEIPVDIYELGLIYDVVIQEDASVYIKMTLTSPACPVAESLPNEVEQKVAGVQGVKSAKVEITFEPPWDRTMMSEAAQLELGFMRSPRRTAPRACSGPSNAL
ncbi:MAG: SUF system Fe-S cluster assembly protein [Flavobacteriales bacterium]